MKIYVRGGRTKNEPIPVKWTKKGKIFLPSDFSLAAVFFAAARYGLAFPWASKFPNAAVSAQYDRMI
jgi:hypothetical protein